MTVGKNTSFKTFPAALDHLYSMLNFVCEHVIEAGFTEMEMAKIELACEEALVNVISYAYPQKSGQVEINCHHLQKGGIEIRITDQGIPYDPVSHADISKKTIDDPDPIELRKLGGYGIFFILTLMDEVSYKREGECNVLTLVKKK